MQGDLHPCPPSPPYNPTPLPSLHPCLPFTPYTPASLHPCILQSSLHPQSVLERRLLDPTFVRINPFIQIFVLVHWQTIGVALTFPVTVTVITITIVFTIATITTTSVVLIPSLVLSQTLSTNYHTFRTLVKTWDYCIVRTWNRGLTNAGWQSVSPRYCKALDQK